MQYSLAFFCPLLLPRDSVVVAWVIDDDDDDRVRVRFFRFQLALLFSGVATFLSAVCGRSPLTGGVFGLFYVCSIPRFLDVFIDFRAFHVQPGDERATHTQTG